MRFIDSSVYRLRWRLEVGSLCVHRCREGCLHVQGQRACNVVEAALYYEPDLRGVFMICDLNVMYFKRN